MFKKTLICLSLVLTQQAYALDYPDQARVVDVRPMYQNVQRPIQVCDQYAQPQQQAQGPNIGGALLGAVAGGLLGKTVGKGNGNKAAIGVGAATGAIIGSQYGNNDGPSGPNCRTEYEQDQRISGHQVTLDFHGKTLQTTTPENAPPPRLGDFMGVHVNVTAEPGRYNQVPPMDNMNPAYRQDRRW